MRRIRSFLENALARTYNYSDWLLRCFINRGHSTKFMSQLGMYMCVVTVSSTIPYTGFVVYPHALLLLRILQEKASRDEIKKSTCYILHYENGHTSPPA